MLHIEGVMALSGKTIFLDLDMMSDLFMIAYEIFIHMKNVKKKKIIIAKARFLG
jgi:hypothetical protein